MFTAVLIASAAGMLWLSAAELYRSTR